MKLINLVCLVLTVACMLGSCNASKPITTEPITTEPTTQESDTPPEALTFLDMVELDPDKSNLPLYDELKKIKVDMTIEEVYSILGKPQRTEIRLLPITPTTSLALDRQCYIYDSVDGGSIYIAFASEESINQMKVSIVGKA